MSRANANIFLILLLVSCTFSVANGHSINYEKIGFSRALQKAQNYQQIIFIQLTSDCERCDQVAEDGLSGKDPLMQSASYVASKGRQAGSLRVVPRESGIRGTPGHCEWMS